MLLNIICLLIILFAGKAVFLRNSIHNVLALVFAFFASAGLMIHCGLEVLGFVLIIVYVGAVAVLFIFMLMMFPKESPVQRASNNLFAAVSVATLLIICFIVTQNPTSSIDVITSFTVSEFAVALYQKHPAGVLLMGGLLFVSMVVIVGLTLPRNYAQREKRMMSEKEAPAPLTRMHVKLHGGIDE